MKKVFLVFSIWIFLLSACAPSTEVPPTSTISIEDAVKTVSVSTGKTLTAVAPTRTPKPTKTKIPTLTPRPTATKTPIPEPFNLSGSGDSVVDVKKWFGPALVKITHTGFGNFTVKNYSASGDTIDLLVNEIGNYIGTRPIDFYDKQETARFEINADGAWNIQVMPLQYVRKEAIPGGISGNGDDVIAIVGDNPDLIKSNYPGDSNFVIISYGYGGTDLLVNEIGPYSGTTIIPRDTMMLEIVATGPWTLEITQK